jgi:hypothetical protein
MLQETARVSAKRDDLSMPSIHPILLLVTTLLGVLSALIIWGFFQDWSHRHNELLLETETDLRLWLLALTLFAVGVFTTFLLFIFIR